MHYKTQRERVREGGGGVVVVVVVGGVQRRIILFASVILCDGNFCFNWWKPTKDAVQKKQLSNTWKVQKNAIY